MGAANLWDEVLVRIETKVNKHSFYTWFRPTSFVAVRGNELVVRVPNPVFRDWLTKH
jgi:chromosomal replication initiator protein